MPPARGRRGAPHGWRSGGPAGGRGRGGRRSTPLAARGPGCGRTRRSAPRPPPAPTSAVPWFPGAAPTLGHPGREATVADLAPVVVDERRQELLGQVAPRGRGGVGRMPPGPAAGLLEGARHRHGVVDPAEGHLDRGALADGAEGDAELV